MKAQVLPFSLLGRVCPLSVQRPEAASKLAPFSGAHIIRPLCDLEACSSFSAVVRKWFKIYGRQVTEPCSEKFVLSKTKGVKYKLFSDADQGIKFLISVRGSLHCKILKNK